MTWHLTGLLPRIGGAFARQVAAGALQLVYLIVCSRNLGVEGTGIYFVALIFPELVLQVLNLGVASSCVYLVASGRFTAIRAWTSSRDFAIGASALGLAAGGVYILLLAPLLMPDVNPLVLTLALLYFPVALLNGIVNGLFLACHRFAVFNAITLIQPVAAVSLLLVLTPIARMSVWVCVAVFVISHTTMLAIGLLSLGKMLRTRRYGLFSAPAGIRGRYLQQAIRYGFVASASNIITYFNYRGNLFLVSFFLGPGSAGIFGASLRIAEMMWLISQSAASILFPILATLESQDEKHQSTTSLMTRAVFWTTLLLSVFVALNSEFLLSTMFGASFGTGAIALRLLSPGIVFFSASKVLAAAAASKGRVEHNLIVAIFVLAMNLGAGLVLIAVFGLVGAAIAMSMALGFDLLFRLFWAREVLGLHGPSVLLPRRQDFTLVASLVSSTLRRMLNDKRPS